MTEVKKRSLADQFRQVAEALEELKKPDWVQAPDGWIYNRKGEKIKKWFRGLLSRVESRIWLPKLENISKIEALRWKCYQRAHKESRELYAAVFSDVVEATPFKAQKKHSKGKGWVIFETHRSLHDDESRSVSWQWDTHATSGINDILERQDLCDRWFAYESRNRQLWGRTYVCKKALEEAIRHNYKNHFAHGPYEVPGALSVLINGRQYLCRQVTSSSSNDFFLALPESIETIEVSS